MTHRLLRLATLVLAAAAMTSTVAAHAEDSPEEMAETVAEAADRCRKMGGTPETAKILRSDDLNRDGRPDWIADYSKLVCKNGGNPACNPNGCLMQLYYWSGDDWDKVFEDFVKGYKFSTSGPSRLMHVTTYGAPCNRPANETCNYTYRLDKEALTPMR